MRTLWEWIALGIVVLTLLAILGGIMTSTFSTYGWTSIVVAVWTSLFVISLGKIII